MISGVEARLIIDSKITHLIECIQELRSERNKLAPISILPPEILALIFYFASVGRRATSRFFPCYYFTHVSQSWRSIALTTPNLWQVLPRGDMRWADVFLERSKGTELVVQEDFSVSRSARITFLKQVLANHTSQIRELVLSNIEIPTLATLLGDLPQASLRLQSLELSLSETVPERQPTFPISILETGNLQTLAIHGCNISHWYSLSFPVLTSLRLRHVLERLPLIKFLDMLRGAPSLRILDMDESLPLSISNDLVGRKVGSVLLPNLRRLSLWSKAVANLLAFIIVPRMATLRLTPGLTTPEEAETICHELASFFGHVRQSSYCSLVVTDHKSILQLNAWQDEDTPLCLSLNLDTSTSLDFASNLLQQIIPSFPFSNITTLTFDDSSLCMSTFGCLPNIQHITVLGKGTMELIRALSCKPKNYYTESVVLFPALQSLCIKYYLFEGGMSATLGYLQHCLVERREQKAGLSKLKFTFCNIVAEDVEPLRKVVDEVDLDPAMCYREDLETSEGSEEDDE